MSLKKKIFLEYVWDDVVCFISYWFIVCRSLRCLLYNGCGVVMLDIFEDVIF